MKKTIQMSLILLTVVLFGAGCASKQEASPEDITVVPPVGGMKGIEAVVEYRNGEFNPPSIKVIAGTKVNFVNKSDKSVWIGSNPHPSHTLCPGFDSLGNVALGETYSHIFEQAEECPYHNHIAPLEQGTITAMAIE